MPMQLSRILSFQEKGKETLCLKHKSHVSCLLKHTTMHSFSLFQNGKLFKKAHTLYLL